MRLTRFEADHRRWVLSLHSNACPLCQDGRPCDTGRSLLRRSREVKTADVEAPAPS